MFIRFIGFVLFFYFTSVNLVFAKSARTPEITPDAGISLKGNNQIKNDERIIINKQIKRSVRLTKGRFVSIKSGNLKHEVGYINPGILRPDHYLYYNNLWFIPSYYSNGWTYHVTSLSGTGDSAYEIKDDNCTGKVLNGGQKCYYDLEMGHEFAGNYVFQMHLAFTAKHPDPQIPDSYYDIHTTFYLLVEDPDQQPENAQCMEGSILRIDNMAVSENIPIVGSELSLFYSSEFAAEYDAKIDLEKNPFFAPEMLNFSNQHFYDKNLGRVFYGHGTSNVRPNKELTNNNLRVISSNGKEVYYFDPNGKHLYTKAALTGQTKYTFSYDVNNKLKTITDAFGNVTKVLRDGSGDLIGVEAPYGQVTNISVNGNNLVSSVTSPNSDIYSFTYKTGTELMETFTQPDGKVSTITYNLEGKVIKDKSNSGASISLAKTKRTRGSKIDVTSELGLTTTYINEYRGDQRYQRKEIQPSGLTNYYMEYAESGGKKNANPIISNKTETVEDERLGPNYKRLSLRLLKMGGQSDTTTYSQSISPSSPTDIFTFNTITNTATNNGNIQTSVYNSATKTFTNTSDEGATSTRTINNNEQRTQAKVGNDKAWNFTYDTHGRLTTEIQDNKKGLTYAYNSNGYLKSITNARNEVTSYTYNLAGQVDEVTLPDTRVIEYEYDSIGNVTSITPPSKPKHSFVYNLMGFLDKYLPPALSGLTTKNTTYDYDLDKRLTKITRPDGREIDYTYSTTTGLLDEVALNTTDSYTHTYNSREQITRTDSPDGLYDKYIYYGPKIWRDELWEEGAPPVQLQEIAHTYTTRHLRASSKVKNGTLINYTYNGDDQVTGVGDLDIAYTYPSGRIDTVTLNNIEASYTYDAYGDLVGYEAIYTPGPTSLYSYTLTRDIMGRITAKSETVGATTTNYSYTYDDVGRLTAVTKNGLAYSSYIYDSNSNRTSGVDAGTSFTATYDDQDRLLTYNSKSYEYNANGELKKIELNPSDEILLSHDSLGKLKQVTLVNLDVIDYSLDGKQRRVLREKSGSPSSYTGYIYDGEYRVAAEFDSNGNATKEFISVLGLNSADYMIEDTDKYFFIKDHLGSPRLIVNATNGSIMQKIEYTTFGQITNDTNPGFQPYGFAGGIYDQDTKLTKFGARNYDAEVGRWISKDPIRFKGGDTNLYGYVLQDPVNFIDPSGLKVGDWWDIPANYKRAREIAREELNKRPNAHNNEGDAMRHAEWSRRMTQEINNSTSFCAGVGHEIEGLLGGSPLGETFMDLHNNYQGRKAGRGNKAVNPRDLVTSPGGRTRYGL